MIEHEKNRLCRILGLSWLADTVIESSPKTGQQPPTSDHLRASVGDVVALGAPDGSEALVCPTETAFKEFRTLGQADDTLGIAKMVLYGQAFLVPHGTRAKIIDSGYQRRRVRVLEGDFMARDGWVLSTLMHNPPTEVEESRRLAKEAALNAEQLRQEELARQQADLERAAQAERAQQARLQRFEHDRQEALAASRRLAEWSAQFAQDLNAFDDSRDALHGDPVNSAAACEQLGIAAAKLATTLPARCPDRRVASLLKQALEGYEQAGV